MKLNYPDEKKIWKWVLQWHSRGKSCHGDLRLQIDSNRLFGWTLAWIKSLSREPKNYKDAENLVNERLEQNIKLLLNPHKKIVSEPKALEPCLSGGTRVCTKSGLRLVSFLKTGDQLLGSDGNWVNIVGIKKFPIKDNLYKIKVQNFFPFWATSDHRFLVFSPPDCTKYPGKFRCLETFEKCIECPHRDKVKFKPELKNVLELRKGDQFLFPAKFDFPSAPTKIILKSYNGYSKEIITNENFYYFLGFFLGDGSAELRNKHQNERLIGGKISLSLNNLVDQVKGKKLKNIIKTEFKCKCNTKRNKNHLQLYFFDRPFANWLRDYCYFKTESGKIKSLPDFFFSVQGVKYRALMQGLIDSDGWINSSGQPQFSNVSPKLIQDIMLLKAQNHESISVNGKINTGKAKNWIYQSTFPTKNDRFVRFREDFRLSSLIKIEQVVRTNKKDPSYVYDIQTDGNHLFCLPAGISHNSEWLTIDKATFSKGTVGATKNLDGFMGIIDKGQVEFGVKKSYYHEYFLTGTKINGRLVFRQLPNVWRAKSIDEDAPPKTGKGYTVWMSFFADPLPYVLSPRAIKEKWYPPDGISALPKKIRNEIPAELQYWRFRGEKARRLRDELINQIKDGQVEIEFSENIEVFKEKKPSKKKRIELTSAQQKELKNATIDKIKTPSSSVQTKLRNTLLYDPPDNLKFWWNIHKGGNAPDCLWLAKNSPFTTKTLPTYPGEGKVQCDKYSSLEVEFPDGTHYKILPVKNKSFMNQSG